MVKKSLRAQRIAERKQLPPLLKQSWEQDIFSQVFELLDPYQSIGLYLSMDFEIDTKPIQKYFVDRHLSAPRIVGKDMEFHALHLGIEKHPFGMYEPVESQAIVPEVLIVPMIGFNAQNYRLGFGGGFYDRFLKNYPGRKFGLAFESDRLHFMENHWDVPLDQIITEEKIYSVT